MNRPTKKAYKDDRNVQDVKILDNLNNSETSGNILSYDVLRIIFKFLNGKDLYQAAKVCSVWREAAKSEKQNRLEVEIFLKHCQVKKCDRRQGSYSASFIGNDIQIQPMLALILQKLNEKDEWIQEGCYCENLPKGCSIITLGGYDIVADSIKVGENKVGMSLCAFLPNVSKLYQEMYHISEDFLEKKSLEKNKYITKVLSKLLPSKSNQSHKCLIMLSDDTGYKFTKRFMKALKKQYQPETISLWGGICVNLRACEASKTCSEKLNWCIISFAHPNLKTWSIVLPESCKSEASMIKKLDSFKKEISLKKHSLGFMFACCERVLRKNLEVKVFKKTFPNILLIGLHGDGEYGLNSLSNKRELIDHSYSTIFLVISYE